MSVMQSIISFIYTRHPCSTEERNQKKEKEFYQVKFISE